MRMMWINLPVRAQNQYKFYTENKEKTMLHLLDKCWLMNNVDLNENKINIAQLKIDFHV